MVAWYVDAMEGIKGVRPTLSRNSKCTSSWDGSADAADLRMLNLCGKKCMEKRFHELFDIAGLKVVRLWRWRRQSMSLCKVSGCQHMAMAVRLVVRSVDLRCPNARKRRCIPSGIAAVSPSKYQRLQYLSPRLRALKSCSHMLHQCLMHATEH